MNARGSPDVEDRLARICRTWDESAKQADRVRAVHFCVDGKPLPEGVYDDLFAHIDRHLEFGPEDTALEVGAGSGLLLERIAARTRRAVGTDLSAAQLERVPRLPNVEVYQRDASRLGLPSDTFDKVVCKGVFQYFPTPDYAYASLAEMVRVCKPGGRLFIGDVFNGYLKGVYLRLGAAPSFRPRAILRAWARRLAGGTGDSYLFLAPDEVVRWAARLRCRRADALLQIAPSSPALFKMYRFDVVITK
jgi:SAM-dependent methyltransferase